MILTFVLKIKTNTVRIETGNSAIDDAPFKTLKVIHVKDFTCATVIVLI